VDFDDFGKVLLFGGSEFQRTNWSACSVRLALLRLGNGRLTGQRKHLLSN
jgi:hypothetical protein